MACVPSVLVLLASYDQNLALIALPLAGLPRHNDCSIGYAGSRQLTLPECCP